MYGLEDRLIGVRFPEDTTDFLLFPPKMGSVTATEGFLPSSKALPFRAEVAHTWMYISICYTGTALLCLFNLRQKGKLFS